MSREAEISQEVAQAAAESIAQQAAAEEAERQKAYEAKMKATVDMSHLATKDEVYKKFQEIADENKQLRELLLKAKAQGKAHIEEKNRDPNQEIKEIYGENSLILRKLAKS